MRNPLEATWRAYETSRQSLSVVGVLVDENPDLDAPHLESTAFFECSRDECVSLLVEAESELRDLSVVGLFAVFEQALREHCEQKLDAIAAKTFGEGEFIKALGEWGMKRYMPRDTEQIMRLFCPPVDPQVYNEAHKIRVYRNWVAHGRIGGKLLPVSSEEVLRILTAFLTQAGYL